MAISELYTPPSSNFSEQIWVQKCLLNKPYWRSIAKQVVAMREAAMEQNENLKEAIANGDLSIGDLEMDIRNLKSWKV